MSTTCFPKRMTLSDLLSLVEAKTGYTRPVIEDVIYSFLTAIRLATVYGGTVIKIRRFGKFYPKLYQLPKPIYHKSGVRATMKVGYQVSEGLEVSKWKNTRSILNVVIDALSAGQKLSLMDLLTFAQIVDRVLLNPPTEELSGQAFVSLCKGWLQAIATYPILKRRNVDFRDNCYFYNYRFLGHERKMYVSLDDLSEAEVKEILYPEKSAILFTPTGWTTDSRVRSDKNWGLTKLGKDALTRSISLCNAYLEVKSAKSFG